MFVCVCVQEKNKLVQTYRLLHLCWDVVVLLYKGKTVRSSGSVMSPRQLDIVISLITPNQIELNKHRKYKTILPHNKRLFISFSFGFKTLSFFPNLVKTPVLSHVAGFHGNHRPRPYLEVWLLLSPEQITSSYYSNCRTVLPIPRVGYSTT